MSLYAIKAVQHLPQVCDEGCGTSSGKLPMCRCTTLLMYSTPCLLLKALLQLLKHNINFDILR
jgi:hypothetical protein